MGRIERNYICNYYLGDGSAELSFTSYYRANSKNNIEDFKNAYGYRVSWAQLPYVEIINIYLA